jgi:Bax protein
MQAAFDRIGYDLDAVAQGYVSVPRVLLGTLPPDLDRLDALDARKTLFLRLLLPVVLEINEQIGDDRQTLLRIRATMASGRTLSAEDVQRVLGLADTYDQPDADIDALLKKVDVIPPSLALAQAIEESGWGTSRIARQNNALFGQFGEDDSGDRDYRRFTSLSEAVQSYARNLNTHRAYREFRQLRSTMRGRQGDIDGWELASTLHRYSERGDDYVHSLRSIMQDNRLEDFDSARLNIRRSATIVASSDL